MVCSIRLKLLYFVSYECLFTPPLVWHVFLPNPGLITPEFVAASIPSWCGIFVYSEETSMLTRIEVLVAFEVVFFGMNLFRVFFGLYVSVGFVLWSSGIVFFFALYAELSVKAYYAIQYVFAICVFRFRYESKAFC